MHPQPQDGLAHVKQGREKRALFFASVDAVAPAGIAPAAVPMSGAAKPRRVPEDTAMPDVPVADPAVNDDDRRHIDPVVTDESPMVGEPDEHGVAPHDWL